MERFESEVARVRDSGVLGRSEALARLFEYLAEQAAAGRQIREADIAVDVFGRELDVAGDASVRVYIHRLRKKLDDFYGDAKTRLTLPVGEYRLVLIEAVEPMKRSGPFAWSTGRWLAITVGILALLIAFLGLKAGDARLDNDVVRAAASPLWKGFGKQRPVLVVVGDYYIFGDNEGGPEPRRMIRDFDVNSPEDLEMFLMERPQLQGRYVDIDTYYTPVGATLALREVLPLARRLARDEDRLTVITSSQLTPEMLKDHDTIYVGYMSALRLLQAPVMERSHFEVGETYDEMIDKRTGQAHVSSAGAARPGRPNQDFGYLAAFKGPSGGRIVVVAGGRDIGVMQTAELATDAGQLPKKAPEPFETLYQVEGLGRTNLSAKPVAD